MIDAIALEVHELATWRFGPNLEALDPAAELGLDVELAEPCRFALKEGQMTERLADGNWGGAGRSLPIEKAIRAFREAQRLDAEDERRLPSRGNRSVVRRRKRIKQQYWACGYIR